MRGAAQRQPIETDLPPAISYVDAAGALVACIREQWLLTDGELAALLRGQTDNEQMKRLTVGLRMCRLISDRQCEDMVGQDVLRGL